MSGLITLAAQAIRLNDQPLDRHVEIRAPVFPESKEFLAGYWIVDVNGPERAIAIAAEASTAPGAPIASGDGTTIQHLWIEVREVPSGPPQT